MLKDEEPPMCIECDKRLTIEHILLKRDSYFTTQYLRALLQEISLETIFNFLKDKYFWQDLKFQIFLDYVCLLQMSVKKRRKKKKKKVDIPVLAHTHF